MVADKPAGAPVAFPALALLPIWATFLFLMQKRNALRTTSRVWPMVTTIVI